jgi:hypothetical protein
MLRPRKCAQLIWNSRGKGQRANCVNALQDRMDTISAKAKLVTVMLVPRNVHENHGHTELCHSLLEDSIAR